MRKFDSRVAIGVAIVGVICLLWLAVTGGLIWSTLDEQQKTELINAVGSRVFVLVMMWAVSLVAVGAALRWLVSYFMTAPARLVEEGQVLLGTDVKRQLVPRGSIENRRLTDLINQLVQQREALREEMDSRVQEASRNTELEKSRLAALMSELTKSVVVCNLDGRILLYNNRARMQFRALSQSPTVAGGVELIGLGRSIYGIFDRKLVAHALENIQRRLQRGAATPSAQFVTTTPSGQLLRVQMAPVRAVTSAKPEMTGFVLMLDNITREIEVDSYKDRALHSLTEGSRAALANMQAALEVLDFPDVDDELQDRLLGVIKEETHNLGKRIEDLKSSSVEGFMNRWPLEDMLGADLLAAAVKRMEAAGVTATEAEIDTGLWLKVESFSLLQAFSSLAQHLHDAFAVQNVQLRLEPATTTHAHVDLVWEGDAKNLEQVVGWEVEPIKIGAEVSALSVQDVVERHSGAMWCERNQEQGQAFFRFLLPLASPQEQLDNAALLKSESRPEYYDFDLFQSTEQSRSLEDCKLTELAYTVFDTETTGLNPAQGDEIIQIGAMRIVNNKLLYQEGFEQLVDPQRQIPPESIPIHGIQPDMVKGQPNITQVLPAFYAFARDTVLVAHNAAFDMRFLQLKEKSTGVVFEQPVLDTLLLSAVIHPNQDSHRLEAIAERFNVTILGRHTAMGDAMVTAEIFLRLIPLLAEQGIYTLRQAREAAQKTYYARLKY